MAGSELTRGSGWRFSVTDGTGSERIVVFSWGTINPWPIFWILFQIAAATALDALYQTANPTSRSRLGRQMGHGVAFLLRGHLPFHRVAVQELSMHDLVINVLQLATRPALSTVVHSWFRCDSASSAPLNGRGGIWSNVLKDWTWGISTDIQLFNPFHTSADEKCRHLVTTTFNVVT